MNATMTQGFQAFVVAVATTAASGASVKAVYTSTNEVTGNMVVMYDRAADGSLTLVGEFATDGTGTGGGLSNQGALVLSNDSQWLLVVNAGSNDISVFEVDDDGLMLTDVEPSGGAMPVSLTIDSDLVYALNAAGTGNITGFVLQDDGDLVPLPASTRPLSGAAMTAPAQVQFSPGGDLLVVTERDTNLIDTYIVGSDGLADGPMVHPSNGITPFGFGFTRRGTLIVSEAFGGAPDASAVSSYAVSAEGDLDVISGSVATTETAACWIAVTNNGRFTYTTNTGSGTITGYAIGESDGSLALLDSDGVTAVTGAGSAPTDLALSIGSKYLYALNSATGEIDAFKVNKSNGALTLIDSVSGLPANSTGLAAR
ncbi:MAG: lactonase family protein [Phycisphaerales bacterium]|nr:lactonase family protein [Phycisphaerales bacterium]